MALGICGPKSSRRYLIIVNIITAIVALIFLIVGSVSLGQGGSFKTAFDSFCKEECEERGCSNDVCSQDTPACDCAGMKTSVPTVFFTAPAAGLVSVGVFSLLAAVLGCLAAIRMRAAWLCGYIFMVIFVIILQFAFGVAAAALGNMEHIPDLMEKIVKEDYKDIDWAYFESVLPAGCYAAVSYKANKAEWLVHHPACFSNGTCDRTSQVLQDELKINCCKSNYGCDFDQSMCTTPERCIGGFLANVGTPVAVTALLTLFLQFAAIIWACVIRRETRPGGVFDPKANQL